MTDLVRLLRRIAVTIVGSVVLVVGIVLLVAPGPGILAILLALTIFALEYEWARRRLVQARELARSASEKTATNRVAGATALLFGVAALGLGGVLIFSDILPFSGLGTGLSIALAGLIVLGTTAYSIADVRRRAEAERATDGRPADPPDDDPGSEPPRQPESPARER